MFLPKNYTDFTRLVYLMQSYVFTKHACMHSSVSLSTRGFLLHSFHVILLRQGDAGRRREEKANWSPFGKALSVRQQPMTTCNVLQHCQPP